MVTRIRRASKRRSQPNIRRERDSFLIATGSDPAACGLAHYLEQEGFTIQAPEELCETARVLVDLTTKRSLNAAIKRAVRNHTITEDERRHFKIMKVL